MKSQEFRVMEALFHADLEIKQCEAVQSGLYEFLMANKVSLAHKIVPSSLDSGTMEIAPFVKMRQYSPINNEYWKITNGALDGPTGNWTVRVQSTTNIPADVRGFSPGIRVHIRGQSAGGSVTETAWKIATSVLSLDKKYVTLGLTSQNTSSFLDAAHLGAPVAGILRRGTPNVNEYEEYCPEEPAYINHKIVLSWIEETRWAMCSSQLYDKWRRLALMNPYYKEFFDLPETEKNRQLAKDFQKRWVNSVFWNKGLANQNAADYDLLEDIAAFDGTALGLGVDGGACVGKRANAIGIYEQMAQCNRIVDLQGGQLNFPALFVALYNMMRVREGRNHPNPRVFDFFTDSVTAELLNQGFLAYYQAKSQNMLRLTKDISGMPAATSYGSAVKKAEFGFYYNSYPLFWPQGVVVNVITHNFFDDFLSATGSAGIENVGRVLWVLDFTGIYPGIIKSDRLTAKTGDLQAMARINPRFACVMKVNSRETTMTSLTWTMVVECPAGNLLIENFAAVVPEVAKLVGSYPSTTTTTTTTSTP